MTVRALARCLLAWHRLTHALVFAVLMHGALASGAFSVAREPLELGRSVLDPAWRMVVSQGAQRTKLESLRLTRTVAPEVPTVLLGDATRLVQVVTNLLTNAVKVSHPPCSCASSLAC